MGLILYLVQLPLLEVEVEGQTPMARASRVGLEEEEPRRRQEATSMVVQETPPQLPLRKEIVAA
jgi:hypothetical protein